MNNLLGCNEIGNFSKSDPRSFYSVFTYSFYFKYYLEESFMLRIYNSLHRVLYWHLHFYVGLAIT